METFNLLMDMVETTRPKCIIGIDTEVYFKDEDGVIESYGCELTLCWSNQDGEVSITAPYCTISPPYDNHYDIETLMIAGTSADWDSYIGVAGLSIDEEIALQDLMESKLADYDLNADNVTINLEHY
jgi:hypothetical protein